MSTDSFRKAVENFADALEARMRQIAEETISARVLADEALTVKEAAQVLRLREGRVRELIYAGQRELI